MQIRAFAPWRLENTGVVSLRCGNCGNTTAHEVWVFPSGYQWGLTFLKKPLLGARQYFLVCPVCTNLARELTHDQARRCADDHLRLRE